MKNYVENVSDNPELLESPTLVFYTQEFLGVTFEMAQPKKKNRKSGYVETVEEPHASKCLSWDFVDDEVEVDDDDEDTHFESDTTKLDCEFVDDDDEDIDDGSFPYAFDQLNPVSDELATIYPKNDYRQQPYTSPKLSESETELYNTLF